MVKTRGGISQGDRLRPTASLLEEDMLMKKKNMKNMDNDFSLSSSSHKSTPSYISCSNLSLLSMLLQIKKNETKSLHFGSMNP